MQNLQEHFQEVNNKNQAVFDQVYKEQIALKTRIEELEGINENLKSEIVKLKSQVIGLEDLQNRNTKQLSKMGEQCTMLKEKLMTERLDRTGEFNKSDLLEIARDETIKRLTEESARLFQKIGTERINYESQIEILKAKLCKYEKNEDQIPKISFQFYDPIPKSNSLSQNIATKNSKENIKDSNPLLKQSKTPTSNERPSNEFRSDRTIAVRKQMHGDSCPCCSDYYKITANVPSLNGKDRQQEISRHRAWTKRPNTPPGFWDVDFPDTQKIEENREKMHHKVSILGTESIIVGSSLTNFIASESLKIKKFSAIVIVTDQNVAYHHLEKLVNAFKNEISNLGLQSRLLTYIIPPGEVYKTRETKASIEDFMLSNTCTRDTCLIALGGGVIGDMVGFVAANFMRGIPVFQVPTTLLAMVDSSVGGKTAIDTPHGKNLIGAFHQPTRIFIDINYLKTLPLREFVNGLAEVIKTAAIWCEEDFDLLENNTSKVLDLCGDKQDEDSVELLTKLILGSIQVKAHVVTVDEKEANLRGLLNFGHSVGHAIEAIVFPDLLHGECVSIGMVLEAEISRHLGHLNNISVGRLQRCLSSYGLPVSLNDKIFKSRTKRIVKIDRVLEIMKVDKKNVGNQKRIVLLSKIGKTVEDRATFVNDDTIRKIISPSLLIFSNEIKKNEFKLDVPGSKSISNRALVMAALGKGICRLKGLLHSDDVQVMLEALQKLVGIKFSWEDSGNTLIIEGGGGKLKTPDSEIYLGNAGTASRFLTTVCTLIESTNGKKSILTGNSRMKQRPIGPLVKALNDNGASINFMENEGSFPLEIPALGFKGGLIKLSASISSQYVSSILISAPYAKSPVTLDLSEDSVISQPYIEMTIEMMKSFGILVKKDPSSNKYFIPQGVYSNPNEYLIEADASSATYPLAFAAITGSTVTVTNIGDAEFAVKVLEPMGCTVKQTDKTTTVIGPNYLKPLGKIDMETMTDAFMTAAVLAAVASKDQNNITQITGIANQRVKECNRIAAMKEQLGRCGVYCEELPDGIKIHGIGKNNLVIPENGVKCFDDHRIAMSFSILACAFQSSGFIVTEKKCVEKTWPSWWDTFRNILGVNFEGIDEDHSSTHTTEVTRSKIEVKRSIILIGMRGAGKSHMGKAGAKYLNRKFIDMDGYFEEYTKTDIQEYIKTNGWEQFRKIETECLDKVLKENPENAFIACGGGVVESNINRDRIKGWNGLVIHIKRNIKDIEQYLKMDESRPKFRDDFITIWKRREPIYQECSNSEFYIISPPSETTIVKHYENVEKNFSKFLDFHLSESAFQYPKSDLSFFVSLTDSNIKDTLPYLHKLVSGANAIELRVDLLQSFEPDFILEQISTLRYYSSLPIVFTTRTIAQGGKFSNNNFEKMINLLEFSFKWGCEYVDIEFEDPLDRFNKILSKKGNSLIIGSYHDVIGKDTWTKNGTMIAKYKKLYQCSDIIKLIGKANSFEDNFEYFNFKTNYTKSIELKEKPLIALLMGEKGQLSRSLNSFLTPVTHPDIPIAAAPGQVSIKQIHQVRSGIGLLKSKFFCLFGKPISKSMSPTIHNTGFSELGLPHHYSLQETDQIEKVHEIFQKMDGASVTIPLKLDVLKLCHHIDHSAQIIGAVNTLVRNGDKISGYNTDWIGIKKCVENHLKVDSNCVGIVLGAGGTSRAALYALNQIKSIHKVKIWNRTVSKAQVLANEFKAESFERIEDVLKGESKDTTFIIIGTIPANFQEGLNIKSMYENAKEYKTGIVLDMAYLPRNTRLLEHSSATNQKWQRIEGIEVLLEQAYEQFKLWTGCSPPTDQIRKEVYEKYEKL